MNGVGLSAPRGHALIRSGGRCRGAGDGGPIAPAAAVRSSAWARSLPATQEASDESADPGHPACRSQRCVLLGLFAGAPAAARDTNGIVVYETDFGLKHGAVSRMRGVALSVDPNRLRLEDLTHESPRSHSLGRVPIA